MKKLIAILTAVFMLLACSALAEDTSLQYVLDKGTFVMGFDEAYPPMGFVADDGSHVGYDIDLAKEVAARMGVELVLQPIAWEAKELELDSKNIDCIWSGLTISDTRKEQMDFTIPYLSNQQIMVVMADSGIDSVSKTAGLVLGTQSASASVEVLDANPEIKDALGEVSLFEDFVTALMDLKLGGIDVLLIDSVVGNYYIAQQDDPSAFVVLPEILTAEEYGIGVRKGDAALADAISQQLIAMLNDGTLADITAKWFANDISLIATYAEAYSK